MLQHLPALIKIRFDRSVYQTVNKYLNNKNLNEALSMHPLLVGGNPYSTTSIYLLIQYLEWKWGVYYAEGGTGRIIDGLEKLLIKKDVNNEATVLGFVGAPWTLAAYVVEGKSSKNYSLIKSMAFYEPDLLH